MNELKGVEQVQNDISNSWKEKFDLLDRVGARECFILNIMTSAKFKSLTFKERHKITFNIWAFLFTFIYYFAKGMWHKGAFILGVVFIFTTLLVLFESSVQVELPSVFYWLGTSVICSQISTYDYFKKINQGEKIWASLPNTFGTAVGAVLFPIISLLFCFGVIGSLEGFNSHVATSISVPECSSDEAKQVVLELANKEMIKQAGKGLAESVEISISNIRTQSINDNTGSYGCGAQIDVVGTNGSNTLPITYKVEMLDNNEQFYVSVFGLQ